MCIRDSPRPDPRHPVRLVHEIGQEIDATTQAGPLLAGPLEAAPRIPQVEELARGEDATLGPRQILSLLGEDMAGAHRLIMASRGSRALGGCG